MDHFCLASVSFLDSINPLALLNDAHHLTLEEFLRDFYTRYGLKEKLKDVDAIAAAYRNQLPALYAELDKKYGTTYVKNPPPVFTSEIRESESVDAIGVTPSSTPAVPKSVRKVQVHKIILLGNSGVGKTNLLSRLNKGEFSSEFTSTIGVEFLTHVMQVDNIDVKAQIWDTAGQERFHAMMTTYYRKAVGALLIFDVCDRQSLLGVEKWLEQLLNVAEPGLHAVLVGNKADITAPQRVVSTEEAQQYAAAHHMSYIETSAKTGLNVQEAFHGLISAIHRAQLTELAGSQLVTVDLTGSANGTNRSKSDSFFDCLGL